jgi:hypothetical protein
MRRDREGEIACWRAGDGYIQMTWDEAAWLIQQPGTPALIWIVRKEDGQR